MLNKLFRTSLATLAILLAMFLLMAPGIVIASVWTPLDFIISLAAIASTVLITLLYSKWRWYPAILSASLIAVPPNPYWLSADNHGNWHFTILFEAVTAERIAGFVALYSAAIALFAIMFMAIEQLMPAKRSSQHSSASSANIAISYRD